MNIFIMALEPLDTRYTGQWFDHIPALLGASATARNKEVQVYNVAGEQVESVVTAGAFLNFTATNIWKNTQINKLAEYFADGTVKPGDKVLFTDAWHPGIIQTRYMSDLMDIPVEIHSIWHAGSYDPQDFLGRKVSNKGWSFSAEMAYFEATDFNYFATHFHLAMFERFIYDRTSIDRNKIVISGQTHGELVNKLAPYRGMEKRKLVLFPHRVAPEKQPEIFRDLALHMPDVEFVVCQDKKLTKDEYHKLLGQAKVIFSANLQETLGISAMEGVLVDAIPMVPDRLSYREMYLPEFKYPSEWTESWESYEKNRLQVIAHLRFMLETDAMKPALEEQYEYLMREYLSAEPMVDKLLG